jgi:hypothetical protein
MGELLLGLRLERDAARGFGARFAAGKSGDVGAGPASLAGKRSGWITSTDTAIFLNRNDGGAMRLAVH